MTPFTTAGQELLAEPRLPGCDFVTGLADRTTWETRLAQASHQASRLRQPLCVAIVDLDNLRAVNEEHGRLAGDSLLRRAVKSWTRNIRSTDGLMRLDAHEFGVLLPDCTPCTADRVLARMRDAMPEGESFSAGVAAWDAEEPATELLRRAREALCSAKKPWCAPVQVAGMPEYPATGQPRSRT
ncbi:MAG: GGDEF domain-containing protein [Solirubrobacteraceae bacterium]